MKRLDHAWLGNPHDRAVGRSHRGGHPDELAGEAAFATKISGFEERNHRFLPLGGNDTELHLSVLDVKDGVRWGALGKDVLPLAIGRDRHSAIERRHECAGIEWLLRLSPAHRNTCLPAERANWGRGSGFTHIGSSASRPWPRKLIIAKGKNHWPGTRGIMRIIDKKVHKPHRGPLQFLRSCYLKHRGQPPREATLQS